MLRLVAFAVLGLLAITSAKTGAPIPPTQVAPFELITADLEAKLNTLRELLADPEKFSDHEERIGRAGGVIACLAQAAIEHDDHAKAAYAAPALRDAGLQLRDAEDHAEALAAFQSAEQAWQGKATGEHAREHAWNELMGMYDLMEEMNDRNGGLSRTLRRSRGRIEEQLNASTNAILAIAMLADHEYVSDDDETREWEQLSREYQQAMTSLIKAIRDKDQAKIAEYYQAGNRACDKCHEAFRD